MGTIAQKLSYINDTKSWIKGAIEFQGQPVPSDATFRSYHTYIGEIGRLAPVIDIQTINNLTGAQVIISNQGANVIYSNSIWYEPMGSGTLKFEDFATPASGGDSIIKKITAAGDFAFSFTPNLNLSSNFNFYISVFGFSLRFRSYTDGTKEYEVTFRDGQDSKLKSKHWNQIIIPISEISAAGVDTTSLDTIINSGGSSETEATVLYINDMYFK